MFFQFYPLFLRQYTTKAKDSRGVLSRKKLNAVKGETPSSTLWLRRKLGDQYTRKAHEQNYVSRSAFKLLQIQSKYHIFKRNDTVIDLGAAPGGWTQVALQIVGSKFTKEENEKNKNPSTTNVKNDMKINPEKTQKIGKVISVDIRELHPSVKGSMHLQMDFTDERGVEKLLNLLNNDKADAVLSDMAPSFMGNHQIDHMRLMELSQLAFEFAQKVLREGGNLVLKANRGGTESEFKKRVSDWFEKVEWYKPDASFQDSSEIYLIARNYKGNPKNNKV